MTSTVPPTLPPPALSALPSDLSASVDITVEPALNLVTYTLAGFLDAESVGKVGNARGAAMAQLRCPRNTHLTVIDISRCKIQSQEVIAAFKDGAAPVFVVSLKAGGFGLNLTEADYCFLLDPWWNPATEAQAIDRTHRIGQTKNVMVYRLVARDTVEEKVMALKDAKAKLFAGVMSGGGTSGAGISASDIRRLLE